MRSMILFSTVLAFLSATLLAAESASKTAKGQNIPSEQAKATITLIGPKTSRGLEA